MKKLFFSLFIMFAVLQWRCSNFPFGLGGDDSGDWVALTTVGEEFAQIVLVDFNNPSKYKFITNNDYQSWAPKFSYDRQLLIYHDTRGGEVHNAQLVLYDLESGKTTPLFGNQQQNYEVVGQDVVWNPSNTAIYYGRVVFQGEQDIFSYDFETKTIKPFISRGISSEYPVWFKGADTLIVFSDDTMSTQQAPGFYYMDLNGNYLGRLNNPHFEFIKRDQFSHIKAAWNPDWSEELRLVVYSQKNKTIFRGKKIAVTNMDGSYYETYTSGEFMDSHPVWGPDAKTVLFQRSDFPTGNPRVMILDLETGQVKQFVRPKEIRGATDLAFPDY